MVLLRNAGRKRKALPSYNSNRSKYEHPAVPALQQPRLFGSCNYGTSGEYSDTSKQIWTRQRLHNGPIIKLRTSVCRHVSVTTGVNHVLYYSQPLPVAYTDGAKRCISRDKLVYAILRPLKDKLYNIWSDSVWIDWLSSPIRICG